MAAATDTVSVPMELGSDLDLEMLELPTTPSASVDLDGYVLALSTIRPSPIPPAHPPSIASLATLQLSEHSADEQNAAVQGSASVPNAASKETKGRYPDYLGRDILQDDCGLVLAEMDQTICAFKAAPNAPWWVTPNTVQEMAKEWDSLTKTAKRTAWNDRRRYTTAQKGLSERQDEEGRARRHVKKTQALVLHHETTAEAALRKYEEQSNILNTMTTRTPNRVRTAQGQKVWILQRARDRTKADTDGLHRSYQNAVAQHAAAMTLTGSYQDRYDISALLKRSTASAQKSRKAREGLQRLKSLTADLQHWTDLMKEVNGSAHLIHVAFQEAKEMPAADALPALQFLHKRTQSFTWMLAGKITSLRDNAAEVAPMQRTLQQQTKRRQDIMSRSRRSSAALRQRQALLGPDPYEYPANSNDVRRRPPATSALRLVADDAKESALRPRPFVPPRRTYSATQPRAPYIDDTTSNLHGAHSQSALSSFRPASQYHANAPDPFQWTMDYDAVPSFPGSRRLPAGTLPNPGRGIIDVMEMMPPIMDAVLASNDRANERGPISWIVGRSGYVEGSAYNMQAAYAGLGKQPPHWDLFDIWATARPERALEGWTLDNQFDIGLAVQTRAILFAFVQISVLLPRFNANGCVTSWWGAVISRNAQGDYVRNHVMVPFKAVKLDPRLPAPPGWPRCKCNQVPYLRFVMDPRPGPLGLVCHIGARRTKNARCGIQFDALEVVAARVVRGGGWMVPTCSSKTPCCTKAAWAKFGDWYFNEYNTAPDHPTLPDGLQYAFLDGQGLADQFTDAFWAHNQLE